MSRPFNTDGLMTFPPDNGEPITLNAFESIECAIAFDVRDWSEDRRSAWIYAIVFGWDDADSWVAEKYGWDEDDRKRAIMMHEQWLKVKETEEQPKIVRCEDCKYWVCIECEGMQHTACKLSENPRAPEFLYHPSAKDFCSSGKRKDEVANG